MPWPTELRLSPDKRTLTIAFDSGECHDLAAEYLRVSSPSAEVQGHAPDQRKTVGGKRNVTIAGIEQVGNYAVRLRFDDGHDSGIFSWAYLRDLADHRETRWRTYLAELEAKGLDRDRAGER